jgi:3-hydroxy-D-aspartate aldolase
MLYPPAEIGMAVEDVDTPALMIDLDAFEKNLKTMADAVSSAGSGVALRAHSKTHKCPIIAMRQMALGAVGVCCQKVSEAQAMVDGGVSDVLVSNQVVGRAKLRRLAALAGQARIGVCADNAANIDDLDAAAHEAGQNLSVLVEINVGANRCGVEPGAPALALARQIDAAPNLTFGGLQAYHGSAQHLREYEARRAAIVATTEMTRETVNLLARDGLECAIVGGAGTGTYQFEAASGVYNELQAGSYIFMDADYRRNLRADGEFIDEFENALFVHATVMSKPGDTHAVVDAGLKAYSVDSGLPVLRDYPELDIAGASDEHGKIALTPAFNDSNKSIEVGDKVFLIPGHVDPTVNLYDWYVCYRGDRVEALWPITARGALQ